MKILSLVHRKISSPSSLIKPTYLIPLLMHFKAKEIKSLFASFLELSAEKVKNLSL